MKVFKFKRLLKIFLGLSIFFGIFFGLNNHQNITYGQSTPDSSAIGNQIEEKDKTIEQSLQETKTFLDIILKIIYMVSRPLLIIAGNAMDNSLVYGGLFHLDAPLWKFWNIMKNFANYTLGFLLLYHILKSLFNRKGIGSFKDKDSPLGIVKKILIAGILIQASRFLLSVIIDISTIATYAVGGMPLTILKNSDIGDQKVLGINSSINLSDKTDPNSSDTTKDVVIYRTYGEDNKHKIANCKIGSGKKNGGYIIGKEINFITSGQDQIVLKEGMCVLGGVPYTFNEFPELKSITGNDSYKKMIDSKILSNPTLSGYEECGFVIPIFAQLKYDPQNCYDNGTKVDPATLLGTGQFGAEGGSGRLNDPGNIGTTISTLIEKSKGFVGPLVTIYSSTLNMTQLINTNEGGESFSFGIVLKFMIRALIGLMLILPILALAIIMLARIGILRMTIAFTPIIVIDQVFELKIFDEMEFLKVGNIIKIIFAPVFIVFGLSIALIFMSTLSSILKSNENLDPNVVSQKEATLESMGITKPADEKKDCHTILKTRTFCTDLNIGGGLDNISYFLINIFGIAVMWSLLFGVIKQTGSVGESIGKGIEKIGKDFAGNIPIVPIAGGIGINQAVGGPGSFVNTIGDSIGSGMRKEQQEELAKRFPQFYNPPKEENAKEEKTSAGNPQISTEQIESITKEVKKGTVINQEALENLVGEETTKQLKEKNISITDRIKEPENIKLIYEAFEKQGLNKSKEDIVNNFNKLGIGIMDIGTVKDYQAAIPNKDVGTIINDLNTNKLEALLTIALDTEIELLDASGSSTKKKYKIKKNGNKYESEEITTTK